jgi:hypothetical protein
MTEHKSDPISPDEEEISEAQLQAARQQMQARLTELFRRGGEQEPTRLLFDTLARYRSGET